MSKRLRNDEEERDSPWTSSKKHQNDDFDDDILALLLLDGPVKDEYFTALLTDSDSDLSFFSFYETNDMMMNGCTESPPAMVIQTMLSSSVTINGNDETCGSSYSDWRSSVMAGFSVSPVPPGGKCTPRADDDIGGLEDVNFLLDGEGDEDDVSLAFLNEVLSSEQQQSLA